MLPCKVGDNLCINALTKLRKIIVNHTLIEIMILHNNPLSQHIPELRRVIEITDYDSGEPITHKLELYKTDRIDCYKVLVDGKLWKNRIGWSNILAGIRKALPRLTSE